MRRLLCLLVAAAPGVWAGSESERSPRNILDRAAEVQREASARKLAYRFEHTYRSRELQGGEAADEEMVHRYEVEPQDGEHFYHLVEKDGEPATSRDLNRERRMKRKFRALFRKESDDESGRTGFEIDRELLDRYAFESRPSVEIAGRMAWAIAFRPQDERPAIERRIDYALNALEGVLYIDSEDYGLARVDFRLSERVRVWGGLLARLERFDGRLELERLEAGLWTPREMRLRSEGRVLLDSTNQLVEMSWYGFEKGP